MYKLLKKILGNFETEEIELSESEKRATENAEIISAYNKIKESIPSYDKPNYTLAEKVFREFNDFNLKNIESMTVMYLGYVPKSLLPYPKNYIKCAYYIFLEKIEKDKNIEIFNAVQGVGHSLFVEYPDYIKYKENLKYKKITDEAFKDLNPRESFKKLYGIYEVSEEDYYSSPSSTDCTEEKLIHDFGVVPEIEEDVSVGEIIKKYDPK